MDSTLVVGLLMSAIVGAGVAWKYASWNLYRRPGAEWPTDEISPERINRRLLARRKRHRIQIAAMSALVSPVIVYALLLFLEFLIEASRTR